MGLDRIWLAGGSLRGRRVGAGVATFTADCDDSGRRKWVPRSAGYAGSTGLNALVSRFDRRQEKFLNFGPKEELWGTSILC